MTTGAPSSVMPGVSPAQAWGTVFLLFLASIVSVIDRQILGIVVDAVKRDLVISDVQVSLLQGLAFGIFYATMGVWLGFVADRVSRRWLIMAGILLWSLATIGGGLAASYGQLFASRLLVGLGEAALSPAAISLIADLFPPGRRGRAVGCFVMGQSAANGIAVLFSGQILAAAAAGGFAGVPVAEGLAPWRVLFLVCGGVGIVVALAFLLTREPARLDRDAAAPGRGQVKRTIGRLWGDRGRFVNVYLGFAFYFLGSYGAAAWQLAMIMRRFDVTPLAVSTIFGPLAIAFGLAGPLAGGWLADRFVRAHGTDGILRILMVAPLLGIVSACGALAPTFELACVLCATLGGVSAIIGATTLSWLQAAAPADMRGTAVSITGLVNTLIGATMGPLLVALLTDEVFGDPAKVGVALLMVAVPAYILSALLYARAGGATRPATGEARLA